MRYLDRQAARFWEQWPALLAALIHKYEALMPHPDSGFHQLRQQMEYLRHGGSINEVRKLLADLWDFDERFFGDPFGYDYNWPVYSLVYLAQQSEIIDQLLKIYVPLLTNDYVAHSCGRHFCDMVGSTFVDDVAHYLYDIQGLQEADDHEFFDWHANRNRLPASTIQQFLAYAGLPPLHQPDYPPSWVLLRFTNMQYQPDSEISFQLDLWQFYRNQGHVLPSPA